MTALLYFAPLNERSTNEESTFLTSEERRLTTTPGCVPLRHPLFGVDGILNFSALNSFPNDERPPVVRPRLPQCMLPVSRNRFVDLGYLQHFSRIPFDLAFSPLTASSLPFNPLNPLLLVT